MKYLATILFLLTTTLCFSQGKKYFVDGVTGNDANSAAQAQVQATPWKTIAKVQSFFASLAAGDTVFFQGGQTFSGTLTPTKSGTAVSPIAFSSYGTGKAIITGMTTVPSFTGLGGSIFESTSAVSTLTTCNIITINGNFVAVGRWPNSGYRTVGSATATTMTDGSLPASPTYIGGQIVFKTSTFVISKATITNQAGTTITFQNFGTTPAGGNGYFIQNNINTLDVQNEWSYNSTTKKLDIFSSVSPTNAQVPTVDQLITITNQSFLSFNNLQFVGANQYLFALSTATNITIRNCDLKFAGVNSINAVGACTALNFNNSSHDYANNNHYEFSGGTSGSFTNNTYNHAGTVAGMGSNGAGNTGLGTYCGVTMAGSNITFNNNQVRNCGYNGIVFQANNVTIKNNFIDSFCSVKDDGGGIYTWNGTRTPGDHWTARVIDGNIVLHGLSAGNILTNGIYMDDNTNSVTITNNTCAFMNFKGIYLHNSHNINMRGNTCYANGVTQLSMTHGAGKDRLDTIVSAQNIWFAKVLSNSNVWEIQSNAANDPRNFGRSDSNWLAQPINQNTNIVFTNINGAFTHYSIPQWQTFATPFDLHTLPAPKTITDTSQLKFFENHTFSPQTFSFSGTYVDVKNTSYTGSVTLLPFTSVVLILSSSVNPPLSATATVAVNPVTCFGNTTSITVNATGGTAPYLYKIGAGAFSSTNVFTNLGAGTYTFTVQDAALATTTVNATIVQPAQISISQSSGTITINGGTTTTTVTANGGTGALQYKLDAGSFQASNAFTGVGAGTHTITVRDANLCTNTLTYTLTQPTALSLTATPTTNPLACNGNVTNVNLSATGGTTPYQYNVNGGSFQVSNSFSLGAGTYTFTVRDAANATTTTTLTITQPTAITISQTSGTIAVNGGTTTTTVTASGGTGTLNYKLDAGSFQASNVFTGVAAGTHTITVRDANNCINTLSYTLTQPSSLSVSASLTTAIACSGGTATATVTASGGTTPYQYQVDGGTLQSSAVFSGLSAATHTFTVHDAGGAIVSTQLTITQPSQISIATAFGSAPTTVTVTASGGVGTLTYSLDGGSFQSGNTFANVAAGNHTVTVKDSNGCANSQSFSVGSNLTISLSVGTISCNGGTTSATVIPAGGTLPYTFLWSTSAQTSTVSGLVAGTYDVSVHDNAGHVHDTTFTITQPTAISIAVATGTILVNGGTTTVTVTAGGGVAPLQYKLDAGAFQLSNSFAGVSAGNHTITVKDANSCTQTQNFTISQPGVLIISISRGAAIACNGGTQAITVGASGGTSPYTGTGVFNKLAGTYTFSVTDAFGSQADTIITVTQPAAIAIAVTTGTITVNGGTTTVTATATGGTGALQYQLDAGSFQGTGNFTGVSAGSHTVTVKDASNCTNVNTFSISQPSALNLTATPATNPFTCYGDVTTVTVVGSGGTTPFTYGKNGVFGGSGSFTNISAGTYTFSVKDAFGAQHDTIITISQPPLISLTQVSSSTILTYGANADSVTIFNAGGTPVNDTLYYYALDGGSYTLSDSAFKYVIYNVAGGNHTVSIKDNNGCIVTYAFNVPQPPPPLPIWINRKPKRRVYVQL